MSSNDYVNRTLTQGQIFMKLMYVIDDPNLNKYQIKTLADFKNLKSIIMRIINHTQDKQNKGIKVLETFN